MAVNEVFRFSLYWLGRAKISLQAFSDTAISLLEPLLLSTITETPLKSLWLPHAACVLEQQEPVGDIDAAGRNRRVESSREGESQGPFPRSNDRMDD